MKWEKISNLTVKNTLQEFCILQGADMVRLGAHVSNG